MTDKVTKKLKVNKDTNIAEVISEFPKVAEVMLGYGLHCVGCFANQFDTIEAGASIHGMDEDEIQEMIEEINMVISGKANLDD